MTVGNPETVTGRILPWQTLYGSVPYVYQMGKYDVTVGQYVVFLNAVATTSDPYGVYNLSMGTDHATVGISRTVVSGTYSYSVTGTAPSKNNMPVFDVTFGDAARFCNWLQNGQLTTGVENSTTTETGAYALNGGTSDRR